MTDAKECIRLQLIEWQKEGTARMPALSGAEEMLAALELNGLVVVPRRPTDAMLIAGVQVAPNGTAFSGVPSWNAMIEAFAPLSQCPRCNSTDRAGDWKGCAHPFHDEAKLSALAAGRAS